MKIINNSVTSVFSLPSLSKRGEGACEGGKWSGLDLRRLLHLDLLMLSLCLISSTTVILSQLCQHNLLEVIGHDLKIMILDPPTQFGYN